MKNEINPIIVKDINYYTFILFMKIKASLEFLVIFMCDLFTKLKKPLKVKNLIHLTRRVIKCVPFK